MSTTFAPRDCGPQAWKDWLRQGRSLVWRGAASWLPLNLVWLLAMAAVGLSDFTSFRPGLYLFMVMTLVTWAVHLAVAEVLAEGHTSLGAVGRAVRDDMREHGARYVRAMALRLALLLVVGGLVALIFYLFTDPAPVKTPPTATPFAPWVVVAAGMHLWLLCAMLSHVGLTLNAMGFQPQLSWKAGLPLPLVSKLDQEAYTKNRLSLLWVKWLALFSVMLAIFVPFSPLLLEPFWAAVNRCAFADIFDQNPGLKAVQTETVQAPLGALPA